MLGGQDDLGSADIYGVGDLISCSATSPSELAAAQGSALRCGAGVADFRFDALLGNGSYSIGRLTVLAIVRERQEEVELKVNDR